MQTGRQEGTPPLFLLQPCLPSALLLGEPTNDPAGKAEMGFAESQPQRPEQRSEGLVLQDSNLTGIMYFRQCLLQYVFGVHLTPVCI